MSVTDGPTTEAPHSGNRKVMIYVPPELHRAMRQVALDENRTESDVYGEAAQTFLTARGIPPVRTPARIAEANSQSSTMADLVKAIEHQGRRIDEVHASIAATRTAGNGSAPAGTKAAGAMKLLLGILKEAGAAGVGRRDLATAMHEAGVKSGTTEVAQAVLRGAGVVRTERGRWFIDGV